MGRAWDRASGSREVAARCVCRVAKAGATRTFAESGLRTKYGEVGRAGCVWGFGRSWWAALGVGSKVGINQATAPRASKSCEAVGGWTVGLSAAALRASVGTATQTVSGASSILRCSARATLPLGRTQRA